MPITAAPISGFTWKPKSSPTKVSMRLHHLGDPFDPSKVPPPRLDGSQESGFGVYLITQSVDEVRYYRDERGRNCIASTKTPLAAICRRREHMEITVEKASDVAVVAVPVEELDAGNTAEFKRDMAPVLDANAKVVLDLTRLRFIDSSGLGAFLSCLRKVNARRRRLEAVRHVEAGPDGHSNWCECTACWISLARERRPCAHFTPESRPRTNVNRDAGSPMSDAKP